MHNDSSAIAPAHSPFNAETEAAYRFAVIRDITQRVLATSDDLGIGELGTVLDLSGDEFKDNFPAIECLYIAADMLIKEGLGPDHEAMEHIAAAFLHLTNRKLFAEVSNG